MATKKKTKKKRPVGRPDKLTEETQEKIIKALRVGAYMETAAAHAGVNKDTFYHWLRRGSEEARRRKSGKPARPTESRYVKFSDAVQKAIADAELSSVANIARHAQTQWQADAWRLERRFPDRYSRRERQDINHSGELKVTTMADLVREAAKAEREEKNRP